MLDRRFLLTLALVASTASIAAQGRLWIVDRNGGPGVHFTDIPPAIAAAAAGDRIEVRGGGPYSMFTLDKGLEIEALSRASAPGCSIQNIAASEWARLVGFDFLAGRDENDPRTGITVQNCRGPVLVSSVASIRQLGGLAAAVIASDAVLLVDSTLQGGYGDVEFSSFAKEGLRVESSRVVVQRCRVTGGIGEGALFEFFVPARGAPGVRAIGSRVLLVESQIAGGNGGFGRLDPPNVCVAGAQGGPAVIIDGDGMVMARSSVTGGAGGNAPSGCPRGQPGEAIVASAAAARVTVDCTITGALVNTSLIAARPFVQTPGAAARGSTATFTLRGAPGQAVALLFGSPHADLAVPGFDGSLLIAPSGLLALPGVTLGASGSAPLALRIPNLPEFANQRVFVQPVTIEATTIVFANVGDLRIL